MNKDARIYGTIIGIVSLLYILSSSFKIASLNDLFVLSAALGFIAIAGKILKDNKIADKLNRLGGAQAKGRRHSLNECREIAKDWAKKNYDGEVKKARGMSFDWTQASTDIAHVYNFKDEEWIEARYFYTPYGPKNKGTLIFVDATYGETITSKPVKKSVLKDEPFEHLEMYRMTKNMRSMVARGNVDGNNQQPMINGIPVNQNMFQQPNNSNGGDQ